MEIMSPAGNFETLAAAVNAGAGSVYFGLGKLNMRAKSTVNFSEDDLPEIVNYCSQNNVNSYLAVNTVMFDDDLDEMRRIIDLAKVSGVTAIIASDTAVLNYARSQGVEIHASTQLNISNIEAVKFFAAYCDVMVLARELSLDKIKYISSQIREQNIRGPKGELVKIEIFVHGALCMATSGKCYLSLHEMNFSANRGQCLQICRRGYTVTDIETGRQLNIENEYIMSPKDLCTVGFIDKIIDAGVSVMKIEGRARPPEYVTTVTKVYRQAVDAVENNTFNADLAESLTLKLRDVFNRDFWDGYYLGARLGQWNDAYGNKAKYHKEFIGVITNYFSRLQVGEMFVNSSQGLSVGDKVLIIGPTTGCLELEITQLRNNDGVVENALKGDTVSFPVEQKIRRADKLYKLVENNFY